MAENKKDVQFLEKMALVTDAVQNLFDGKCSIVFELPRNEYVRVINHFEPNPEPDKKQFKVEISGTDFIFLLDES